MRFVAVVFLVAVTSIMRADDAKPMPPKELAEFLGPVSPKAFHWVKYTMVDFDLYNGEALPPLSGRVGFYLGGHPNFQPDPGSTTVKGRFGIFPVKWYRIVTKNRSVSQRALIQLDDYWQVDIGVTAKRQEDVDRLIGILSQLPTFNKRPKPIGPQ
jgi:hypothetical protein